MRKKGDIDTAAIAEAARAIRKAAIRIEAPRGVPLTVVDGTVEGRGSDTWLVIQTDKGRVALLVEGGAGSASLQDEGQSHLGRLSDAVGIAINEPADLQGHSFMIVGDTFAAVAAKAA